MIFSENRYPLFGIMPSLNHGISPARKEDKSFTLRRKCRYLGVLRVDLTVEEGPYGLSAELVRHFGLRPRQRDLCRPVRPRSQAGRIAADRPGRFCPAEEAAAAPAGG